MVKIIFACMLFLSQGLALAKDFGVRGQCFAIKEQDILLSIQAKLENLQGSGDLALHQEKIKTKFKQSIIRPKAVANLSPCTKFKQFEFDPSYFSPNNILDHRGEIVYRAGQRVNPLDYVSMRGQWLFVMGEDVKQVAWAKQQYQAEDKVILVNGSAIELMQTWPIPIYFDQKGLLIQKFGIRHLPAKLFQAQKKLMVEEHPLEPQA